MAEYRYDPKPGTIRPFPIIEPIPIPGPTPTPIEPPNLRWLFSLMLLGSAKDLGGTGLKV